MLALRFILLICYRYGLKLAREGRRGLSMLDIVGGKMSERENLYTNGNNSLSDSWVDV